MGGTTAGGKLAAKKNKKLYGSDFYAVIGRKGGTQTYKSGKLALVSFAARPEDARKYGALGGAKSRRGPSKKTLEARRQAALEKQRMEATSRELPVAVQPRGNVLARLRMSLRRKKGVVSER